MCMDYLCLEVIGCLLVEVDLEKLRQNISLGHGFSMLWCVTTDLTQCPRCCRLGGGGGTRKCVGGAGRDFGDNNTIITELMKDFFLTTSLGKKISFD